MVAYNEYKPPGLTQWTGSTVNATIVLDQPGNVSFTNLDEISGRVVVRTGKAIDVSTIAVKLEGESRTRLMSPGGGPNNEKPRPQLEYHKTLYRVQTVFPPPDVLEGRGLAYGRGAYTLPIGQHEYPFSFKLPFNNTCHSVGPDGPQLSMLPAGLEFVRAPTQHVRKTLPPTLAGFPGEAEIRYYVKATVARQSIFKENPRTYVPFTFMPIEPPRRPPSGSEIFARQRHTFRVEALDDPLAAKTKSIFGRKASTPPASDPGEQGRVSVDVRLPEPAILTCNATVPLRILVKRLSNFRGSLRLHSLQIALIGHTKIRAHELSRTESNSWIIVSKSNIDEPIGTAVDAADTEIVLDDSLWRNSALPNTVAPSFVTCNISRAYQLDIRIGVNYVAQPNNGGKGSKGISAELPQSIILPLRLAVEVYSGIDPPAELLDRMASSKAEQPSNLPGKVPDVGGKAEAHVPTPLVSDQSGLQSNTIPPTPIEGGGLPESTGVSMSAAPPDYNEAPPSYEDAIASDIRPVAAPRPEYQPPTPGEDAALHRREKGGWLG